MISQNIEHKGIVKKIENNKLFATIDTVSACGSCHANSICSAFNTTEKEIEISNFSNELQEGDNVTIFMKEKFGFIAVLFGYILPFFVLILTLLISFEITNKEMFSGVVTLLSIVIYFVVLYLFRNKIKKTFSFSAEKLN